MWTSCRTAVNGLYTVMPWDPSHVGCLCHVVIQYKYAFLLSLVYFLTVATLRLSVSYTVTCTSFDCCNWRLSTVLQCVLVLVVIGCLHRWDVPYVALFHTHACVDFSVMPLHTKQHSYIICVYNDCPVFIPLALWFSIILWVLAGLVFVNGLLHFSVLQGPSSDQKAVSRYKVEEEARKSSKRETVSWVWLSWSLWWWA